MPPFKNVEDYLFVTEVGSRMWGVEEFAGDYELFHCFQTPAYEYLSTGNFGHTRPSRRYFDDESRDINAQYMEIGHLVDLLKKGDVNALWAVCSPVVRKDNLVLQDLRSVTLANLSKQSYHSIKGVVGSQFADAVMRANFNKTPQKALATSLRTLKFGIKLLSEGEVDFHVDRYACRPRTRMILSGLQDLYQAYMNSNLPCIPDPGPFEKFLYGFRMHEILAEHDRKCIQ